MTPHIRLLLFGTSLNTAKRVSIHWKSILFEKKTIYNNFYSVQTFLETIFPCTDANVPVENICHE